MRKLLMVVIALVALVGIAAGVVASSPDLLLDLSKGAEHGLAGVSVHEVRVDDDTVVYLEGGAGPTVLMIHGFNADKDNWTRVSRNLTGRYHVVAPDLPGFGQSSRRDDASYDVQAQVARLKRLHDVLGLGPVHVVGNSMGGHIAALYAVRHPDDVASLVLIAPAGVTSPEPSELSKRLAAGENPLVPTTPEGFDKLLDFIFVEPPYIPGVVKDYFASQAALHATFTDKIWADLGAHPVPLEPLLGQIRAPTLVVWGDTDRVLDPSAAEVFATLIPDAEAVILDRTGHAPMIERPEDVAELLSAHVDAVQASLR